MKSTGIVLIVSGALLAAVVLHAKQQSSVAPSSSASSSPGGGSSANSLAQSFTVALAGGGDVTVNASDPNAALTNAQQETGIAPVGLLTGPGGTPSGG